MTIEQQYLIAVVRAALAEQPAPPLPDALDWAQVLTAADFAQLWGATAIPLLSGNCDLPDGVRDTLRQRLSYAVYLDARQQYEFARVLDGLEARGIRHCPLKGLVLRPMYLRPEMRGMVDADVLIPHTDRRAARELMESLGFTSVGTFGVHDSYQKDGDLIVELHTRLLSERSQFADAMSDAWTSLQPLPGFAYRVQMPLDERYLYLVLHLEKHLSTAGFGVRDVMDIFVFRKRYADALARGMVYERLTALGLIGLTRHLEALADAWFGGADMDETTRANAEFVMNSGLHGTDRQAMLQLMRQERMAHVSKWTYLRRRLFPPMTEMRARYPSLRKAPWLLPFCRIAQWVKQIKGWRGDTRQQWQLLQTVDDEQLARHRDGMERLYGRSPAPKDDRDTQKEASFHENA